MNTNLKQIRQMGAIDALSQELHSNLWDIKLASEAAGKTIVKTFANLQEEISKIEALCAHIRDVYAELEMVRAGLRGER